MLNKACSNVFVFLGPTLSIAEGQKILPNAIYLPPIKCGDIVKLLRLTPKCIIIIDGYFERTAAVWHKEILAAIESGVTVVGASSMGALRAAELSAFGMQGVGQIYQDFVNGILEDDDEVAVLHGTAEQDYLCLTDAMVNIRATVNSAMRELLLTEQEAAEIIDQAKKTFYQERELAFVTENILSPEKYQNFVTFLGNGGFVNVKQQDAIAALHYVDDHLAVSQFTNEKFHKTSLLRALTEKSNCTPVPFYYEELPLAEKVTQVARLLTDYPLLKKLGKVLLVSYHLANQQQGKLISPDLAAMFSVAWAESHDMTACMMKNFSDRWRLLQTSMWLVPESTDSSEVINGIAEIFAKLQSNYQPLSILAQQQPLRHRILILIAQLWYYVELRLQEIGVIIDESRFVNMVIEFRQKNNLLTTESMMEWFSEREFTEASLTDAMRMLALFDYIVERQNLDVLNIHSAEPMNVLLDAMCLADCYIPAKNLLLDEQLFEEARQSIDRQVAREGNNALYSIDIASNDEWQQFCGYYSKQQLKDVCSGHS